MEKSKKTEEGENPWSKLISDLREAWIYELSDDGRLKVSNRSRTYTIS